MCVSYLNESQQRICETQNDTALNAPIYSVTQKKTFKYECLEHKYKSQSS